MANFLVVHKIRADGQYDEEFDSEYTLFSTQNKALKYAKSIIKDEWKDDHEKLIRKLKKKWKYSVVE